MPDTSFVFTQQQEADLHAVGFSDEQIRELTPQEAEEIIAATNMVVTNTREVREFIETITAQARAATKDIKTPGVLQMIRVHPLAKDFDDVVVYRYRLDDAQLVERMTKDAVDMSNTGHNVYVETRLVRPGLRAWQRGTKEDTVAVFALAVDLDADKGKAWMPSVPVSLAVETSPGNAHFWFFFERAIDWKTADDLGEGLRKTTGGDADTGVITQPYRVAGTLNYPSKKKQERGRTEIVPTSVRGFDPHTLWTPERFEQEFPPSPKPMNGGGNGQSTSEPDESSIPDETLEAIKSTEKGDRGNILWNVVQTLREDGWTVDGIITLLKRYPNGLARKFKGRLRREVERAWTKLARGPVRARQQQGLSPAVAPPSSPQPGSSSPPPPPPPGAGPSVGPAASGAQPGPQPRRTVIRLVNGRLPWSLNEVDQAVLAAGGGGLYQRAGMMVRPIKVEVFDSEQRKTFCWQMHEVSATYLTDLLTRIIRFQTFDIKANDWLDKDCPKKVAETYLARVGEWEIPELRGVINTPFLRGDGSLCETPGYDAASKLLFNPDGQSFPAVPKAPSKDDASEALAYINKTLFEEFPFVGNVDRAVTLSGLLTAFDQRITAAAPLHGFTAPSAGTGKSLLVDLISILLTGTRAPVIAFGKNDEELEKRIETALIVGDAIISLDNVNRDLTSDVLSQALTQQQLKIRILGRNDRHGIVPATATFFATGNNLTVGGDLPRRTLLSRLDAGIERPELREFKRDVEDVAFAERGKLVAAVLTILRAWQVASAADKASVKAKPLGLFKRWSQRVRAPLLWLGCADPCDSIKDIRDKDPALGQLETILLQWKIALGTTTAHTVRDVILTAIKKVDFFDALAAVALSRHTQTISADRLGRWLSRNEGKVSGKHKLERAGKSAKGPLWRLMDA